MRARANTEPGDVVVIAQKIVSKAEGRQVRLASNAVAARSRLAYIDGKDPRLIELMLRESAKCCAKLGVLIVEHRLRFVMASAGIDQSNVPHRDGEEVALLLPADPDESARRIQGLRDVWRRGRRAHHDSFGRAWRMASPSCNRRRGRSATRRLARRPDRDSRLPA
jgi:coenzyme F420-0:L-glutamate ligase/coenzyme F420-1:gamma-L-glutamate ligase